MIRRPPRSTQSRSSAASDVYKRQIKVIAGAFNPQGTPVTSFKAPSALELAHDYLWRVHQRIPARGEIGIFNRSHYEDVLIVRVHALVPEERWRKRYAVSYTHLRAHETRH